jgi:hypothetical protein
MRFTHLHHFTNLGTKRIDIPRLFGRNLRRIRAGHFCACAIKLGQKWVKRRKKKSDGSRHYRWHRTVRENQVNGLKRADFRNKILIFCVACGAAPAVRKGVLNHNGIFRGRAGVGTAERSASCSQPPPVLGII